MGLESLTMNLICTFTTLHTARRFNLSVTCIISTVFIVIQSFISRHCTPIYCIDCTSEFMGVGKNLVNCNISFGWAYSKINFTKSEPSKKNIYIPNINLIYFSSISCHAGKFVTYLSSTHKK